MEGIDSGGKADWQEFRRSVKIGFSRGEGSRGEEALLWGSQNEGDVQEGLRSEADLGEGNRGPDLPSVVGLLAEGFNASQARAVEGDSGFFEEGRPPSAIGSEIEFEIGRAVGRGQKELGDIVFPKFRLKFPRLSLRMDGGGIAIAGEKVKVGGIESA